MGHDATPVLLALDMLHIGCEREVVVEKLRDRFGLDRHDAVAAVAAAGVRLRRATERQRLWSTPH